MKWYFKTPSILPGFGLSFGLGLFYFSFLVLIPLGALLLFTMKLSLKEFMEIITDKQVLLAFYFSLSTSFVAALINLFFGFIVAWTLARYNFFGKQALEAFVDLPFALPTAVAGISLAFLLSHNGAVGASLLFLGIDLTGKDFIAVVIALTFIGIPFVVRTLEPVIKDLDIQNIEAARSLGANFLQTFIFVILPSLIPSALTGFALAFARGLGEYGSVIFISSNIPFESEILPVIIVSQLDSFNYLKASAIGLFMIISAFVLLLGINFLQKWGQR